MAGRGVASTTNVLQLPGTSGNYVSTPDSAGNSLANDIDVRVQAMSPRWISGDTTTYRCLMAKWGASTNFSWLFLLDTADVANGALKFNISTNGTNNNLATTTQTLSAAGFTNGMVRWVRVTYRKSDKRTQFFWSADGSAWTQIGADVIHPQASVYNSFANVTIGANGSAGTANLWLGDIYKAELRDGIDGTAVQTFDATAVTKLGTRDPATVAAGGPWTLNGSAWDWAAV
jgi:hypothetical protein